MLNCGLVCLRVCMCACFCVRFCVHVYGICVDVLTTITIAWRSLYTTAKHCHQHCNCSEKTKNKPKLDLWASSLKCVYVSGCLDVQY